MENEKIRQIEERLSVTGEQAASLYTYYTLLLEKNKVMNLTRITEFEEVLEKHFEDSLRLLSYVKLAPGMKVLDLGSGAGLPTFPLAILCPETQFVSVDTVGKKIAFQEETADALALKNVTCIKGRAEDLARQKDFRGSFDFVVSRALASLPVLLEYTLPFLKTGGILAAYKTETVQEEIEVSKNALRQLRGSIDQVYYYSVGENRRSFVLVRKDGPTPVAYPRKAGTPSRNPL